MMVRHPAPLLLLLHGACFAPVGKGGDTSGASTSASTDAPDDTAATTTNPDPTGGVDPAMRICTWMQLGLDGPPSPRYGHSLDPGPQGTLVMFAGRDEAKSLNLVDLWTYDNNAWESLAPGVMPGGPSARRGHAAASHPVLGLVVFGGDDDINNGSTDFPGETWAFNGDTWTQLAKSPAPLGRSYATLEYHPPSASLILFGGSDYDDNAVPGTWTLDGSGTWRELAVTSPQARVYHTMALDSTGDLLMHGGCAVNTECTTLLDDTWRWHIDKWEMVDPGGQATRAGGVMTRGTADGTLFRFVGGPNKLETLEWKDGAWVPLPMGQSGNSPATMEKFAAAYRPGPNADAPGEVIVFGGLRSDGSNAETWRFSCDG